VSSRSEDKRWDSKFARFISQYGVELLSARLRITPSAVYHWLHGVNSPHPATAQAIQRLAKRRRVNLSLDDIYEHFREVHAVRFRYARDSRQSDRS
jgi:hypothetical protein